MKKYFVAGIGTDVGKTIVSAVITEALNADYWKPIQAGNLDNTDTNIVKNLVSNQVSKFHKEAYLLTTAASPHYAAMVDDIEIDLNKIKLPATNNHLIIEGAGGLMVPLNSTSLIIDLIKSIDNIEVIIVSQNYLGSINHTLLSIQALKSSNINIKGIVFNGIENKANEDYILNYSQINFLGKINHEPAIDKNTINKYTEIFRRKLF